MIRAPYGAPYGRPYGSAEQTSKLIEEYLPLAQQVIEQGTDASRQVEVLEAQIQNTRILISRTPIGKEILRARLRKLQARKRAAERRLLKMREGESSTRTWRTLGQVGALVGIGVGVAIIVKVIR